MIATRNGLTRSLHVGIYVIMSFLYTLLFMYVVCCQNKTILILNLILILVVFPKGSGKVE